MGYQMRIPSKCRKELKAFVPSSDWITHEVIPSIRSPLTTNEGHSGVVAADVCKALELDKVWNAIQRLDEDEKGTTSISTLGGQQRVNIVNEPGLYALVFEQPQAGSESLQALDYP